MKTLVLILTIAASTLAGSLSEYADSLAGTKAFLGSMDRLAFLVAMDSVMSDWPDSVTAVRGPHGFVFTVCGTTVPEKQMRKVAADRDFIGHSRYAETVIKMLDSYLLMNSQYLPWAPWKYSVADHIAYRLFLGKDWGIYKGDMRPVELTDEEKAMSAAVMGSLFKSGEGSK